MLIHLFFPCDNACMCALEAGDRDDGSIKEKIEYVERWLQKQTIAIQQKRGMVFNSMWNCNELGSHPFCRPLRSLHGMEPQDSVKSTFYESQCSCILMFELILAFLGQEMT